MLYSVQSPACVVLYSVQSPACVVLYSVTLFVLLSNRYWCIFLEIDSDLARKFRNRRQSEYKFLDELKEKCHPSSSDSSPSVQESPRRPTCPKNTLMSDHARGTEWQNRAGRKRKTIDQFMSTTAVSLRDGSFDVNVKVSVSPSKKTSAESVFYDSDGCEFISKRQRLANQRRGTTAGCSSESGELTTRLINVSTD